MSEPPNELLDGPPDGEGFLRVTPAGCYYAVESAERSAERELLVGMLRRPSTPATAEVVASARRLPAFAGAGEGGDGSAAERFATRLVDAGFAERIAAAESLPDGSLSEHLPTVLPALSAGGGAVLIETRQGLFLDCAGVAREEAEQLAALAADLLSLSERRAAPLGERLGVRSGAFAIVDPAGCSEVGFWPLHVADNVFTLTILGIPLLNDPAFRTLVWMLIERYGGEAGAVGER